MTPEQIKELVDQIAVPFYLDWAFWITAVIGVAGLWFSIKAFVEAKAAKLAAVEAGKVVKIETVKIELADIGQRLDRCDPDLDFSAARDLLNEVTRRLRRLIGSFQGIDRYSGPCLALKKTLEDARATLDTVAPLGPDGGVPSKLVYDIMERPFATISGEVGEILGLFETETIESPQ